MNDLPKSPKKVHESTLLISSGMNLLNLIFMKQSLSSHDKLTSLMNGFHIETAVISNLSSHMRLGFWHG